VVQHRTVRMPQATKTEPKQYDFTLYPEIYDIKPRFIGAHGGARITIMGTGFDAGDRNLTNTIVNIGPHNNIPCNVEFVNQTTIKCIVPRLLHDAATKSAFEAQRNKLLIGSDEAYDNTNKAREEAKESGGNKKALSNSLKAFDAEANGYYVDNYVDADGKNYNATDFVGCSRVKVHVGESGGAGSSEFIWDLSERAGVRNLGWNKYE
jgi:hypothetical protein